jgi:protein involved in polysaccharide export with SLBB domain
MKASLSLWTAIALSAAAGWFGSGCAMFSHHHTTTAAASTSEATAFAPTPVESLPPLDASLLQRPTTEYRLGPGDQLEIEVLGDVDTRSLTTVGPDGKIYFYMLPGIDVWGLTIGQARDKIVDGLRQFVRERQPVSVTLRVAESQRVWVLGRLNKPGVYPLTGPTTLLEAIAEAGGLSPRSAMTSLAGPVAMASTRGNDASDEAADLSRAFVIRQGRVLRVDFKRLLRDGDLSQNIYLQPDDFVYLPAGNIGSIHVLGAVFQPRAIETTNQLTLARAVSEAGGTIKDAYLSHVAIVRGSLTQPQVAIVDLNAVQHGQANDVVLEPNDIVYVPYTPYRVLTRYVDMILDTFARTVGVNEGARAVSRGVAPVGVNVPVGVGL